MRNEEPMGALGGDAMSSPLGDNVLGIDTSVDALRQPCVQYDNFAREWMGISQQDNFDGFRVEAGKPLTKYLQATHTLLLGTAAKQQPYSYQFGPVFQTESGRTFLMGKYSMDGLLNARIVKKVLGPYVDLRLNCSSCVKEPQRNMYEFSKDMNFAKWSTSTKLVWQGIWIANFGWSRMMHKNLHLGGELTYLNLNHGSSMGTVGMRYADGENTFSATLGRTPDFKNPGATSPLHGLRMQYVRKVSDRVSLGAEFDYSHPDHDSAMKLGYEYTFRTSRVQGLLDTSGRVSCFVNDFKGFALSGVVDYLNNDYKFGVLMHYFPAGGEGEGEGEALMM